MASISSTTLTSSRMEPLSFTNPRFLSTNFRRSSSHSGISLYRGSDSGLCCRCGVGSSGSEWDSNSYAEGSWRWELDIQETVRNALKRLDGYWRSFRDRGTKASEVVPKKVEEEEEEWDWERWKKHFVEVDEQERLASILKVLRPLYKSAVRAYIRRKVIVWCELASAIAREDYADAARIKIAIAAASTNDTVGRVMSRMKKFVEKEQYGDAALIRDYAGTGLVGWWAGISENSDDPYGHIIHISAEHGRYIARSYNPRQLATASDGSPLFEVYLRHTKNGNYQQRAVYLKRKEDPRDFYSTSFQPSGTSRNLDSNGGSKLFERSSEETEDAEDGDDDSGFDNALQDLNPGLKVKVVQVRAPEKLDPEIISKVIEQIIDEEEGKEDNNLDNVDAGDESQRESDEEHKDFELDSGEMIEEGEENQISVKVVISDVLLQKISRDAHIKELRRIPATLEKKGQMSFTFMLEEDANERLSSDDGQSPKSKRAKLQGQQSIDHVLVDLAKSIGKGQIPMKVLRDVGELVNLTLNQARNPQPLSGSTTFNRIDVSSSADPLNGIYIGSHGLYSSEVIHMKRRFGQWKEDGSTKRLSKLEFYEYVEAVKLTGDANVPAGQVAFRAKVGKGYQLPHKGTIPEEFGVIARYRGQGRLADPGFQNPRWVDGELVILDSKFIEGGPIVGFVYWAPEYHFLVFFNRLRMVD